LHVWQYCLSWYYPIWRKHKLICFLHKNFLNYANKYFYYSCPNIKEISCITIFITKLNFPKVMFLSFLHSLHIGFCIPLIYNFRIYIFLYGVYVKRDTKHVYISIKLIRSVPLNLLYNICIFLCWLDIHGPHNPQKK
jgi:hypothetical protein